MRVGNLCRGADPLALRDKRPDMPLHPAPDRPASGSPPGRGALPWAARAIVGGLEPTATAPFRVEVLPHPRALGRRHAPILTDRPSADTSCPHPLRDSKVSSSSRVATPTATPPWMNSTTAGSTGRHLQAICHETSLHAHGRQPGIAEAVDAGAHGHLKRKLATWLVVSMSLTSNWRHVPFQALSVFQT